jgi:hypothetical protein
MSKLIRSVLRRRVGIKYAYLDPILEELERNGEIRRTEVGFDKKGLPKQVVTLIRILFTKALKSI